MQALRRLPTSLSSRPRIRVHELTESIGLSESNELTESIGLTESNEITGSIGLTEFAESTEFTGSTGTSSRTTALRT